MRRQDAPHAGAGHGSATEQRQRAAVCNWCRHRGGAERPDTDLLVAGIDVIAEPAGTRRREIDAQDGDLARRRRAPVPARSAAQPGKARAEFQPDPLAGRAQPRAVGHGLRTGGFHIALRAP
jgi:hypothetical protein